MNRALNYTGRNKVTTRKGRIGLIGILILLVLIVMSMYIFTKTVTAQGSRERVKLVTSIEIKKGDTLWSIASGFMTDEYRDVNEYVKELKDSNGLTSDTIHAGNYIIVPYFADASN